MGDAAGTSAGSNEKFEDFDGAPRGGGLFKGASRDATGECTLMNSNNALSCRQRDE